MTTHNLTDGEGALGKVEAILAVQGPRLEEINNAQVGISKGSRKSIFALITCPDSFQECMLGNTLGEMIYPLQMVPVTLEGTAEAEDKDCS